MDDIRPWCLSRQLWWGHRLPVWYRGDETYVRIDPPDGPGWERDPDVLDTWFSARCGRSPRSAGRTRRRAGGLLPDRRAAHGARHPLPVGRPHGLHGAEFAGDIPFKDVYIHSTSRRPTGAGCRSRSAPGIDPLALIDGGPRLGVHRRRRLPCLRRRRRALRPARDVLDAGRPLQRGARSRRAASSPTSSSTRRGSCCCGCRRASTVPGEARRPAPVEDTWILSRLRPRGRGARRAREFEFHRADGRCTPSSMASCATGTWRAQAAPVRRGQRRHRRVRALRPVADADARAPADPVRHRGDLVAAAGPRIC